MQMLSIGASGLGNVMWMDLKCPSQPLTGLTNHWPPLVQVFPPVCPGELNDGDKKRKEDQGEREKMVVDSPAL